MTITINTTATTVEAELDAPLAVAGDPAGHITLAPPPPCPDDVDCDRLLGYLQLETTEGMPGFRYEADIPLTNGDSITLTVHIFSADHLPRPF